MATKKKKSSGKLTTTKVRRLSNKKVKSKISKWTKSVSTTNGRIRSADSKVKAAKKKLDAANDILNKKNGYKDAHGAYEEVTKKVTEARDKLKKAKTKRAKAGAKKTLDAILKKQKAAYALMTKLSGPANSAQKSMMAAHRQIASLKKTLSGLKSTKSKQKKTLGIYKQVSSERSKAKTKKKVAKNSALIKKKIKKNRSKKERYNPFVGHTAIYRKDKKSSKVWFLGSADETENNTQDIASNAVDDSNPTARYSKRSDKGYTGTFYMFAANEKKADTLYTQFQKWALRGYEVAIRGFSNWNSALISDVDKNKFYKNAVQMSLTFKYVKPQKIQYTKSKKKAVKKTTGKKAKKSGSGKTKTSKRYVIAKPGTTYSGVALSKHVSLAKVMKLNKYPARKIPIGSKIYYQ